MHVDIKLGNTLESDTYGITLESDNVGFYVYNVVAFVVRLQISVSLHLVLFRCVGFAWF